MLPDKVSHGGTYAGNRVAAAAAVATLEIIRDTNALETIHATGRRIQDGLKEILNPTGIPYHFTGHPVDVRDHVPRGGRQRVPRLGDDGPRAVRRDRGRHARRGAMPEPDSREPWFMCEAHAKGDIVDRVLTSFSDSLDAALEDRAHGAALRRRTAAWPRRGRLSPVNGAQRDGPGRERGPLGRPGGGAPPGPRRQPGRGRRHRTRPPPRACTSPPRRGCWPRSRSAASSSRTTRPASTGSGSSSSASPSGPSGRSTCAGSPVPELERLARLTHETTGLGHPRRRHDADGRPGRRPEPHRRRRLDRADDATPLRRLRQGPAVGPGRARGPAHRPARPGPLHGADDRRARAAARGAGPDPAARVRDRDRGVRAGPQRRRGRRSTMPAAT